MFTLSLHDALPISQEAQLTMFNSEAGNVRAYAVAGSFDDCHRLTKEVFGDTELRRRVRLTSANSVNIGRLLPQMVYYFHAVAQIGAHAGRVLPDAPSGGRASGAAEVIVCTPSGNFGNLTAGLMAKRAGLPIAHFVAATNVNDVVPEYLVTGHFEPRPSVPTKCRNIWSPDTSSRGRRSRRSPTPWTSGIPATSSACSGSTTAIGKPCARTSP